VYNYIGLEPKLWNSGKWNSVKWNETRRIGAIFACFYIARVCQRQLGFLVLTWRKQQTSATRTRNIQIYWTLYAAN